MPHVAAAPGQRSVELDYGITVTPGSSVNVDLTWPMVAAALTAGKIVQLDSSSPPVTPSSGVPWIPLSDKGAAGGVADLDASKQVPTTRLPQLPPLAQLDWVGHSIPYGGGPTAGIQDGYAALLARLLGSQRVRNLAVGGSFACWPGIGTTSGMGGWGWVLGGYDYHGVPAGKSGASAPYLPSRQASIIHATLNDLMLLGSLAPTPMQEALRTLISWQLTAAFINDIDASWSYTGTWSANVLGGFGTGPSGSYHSTTTLNDHATVALPADFPGSLVVAVTVFVNSTHDLTVTPTIDGVAQTPVRLQGSVLCDTANAKHNAYTFRFKNLAAGAHTIDLKMTTQTVASSQLAITDARVEADPLDTLVIVPSSFRPANYTLWNSYAHGPSAGTDPANDAAVATWKTAEQAVVADFGANVVYVDIDTPLAKAAAYFSSDNAHPNERGHEVIAETIYDALRSGGYITQRRRTRPALLPGSAYTRQYGRPSAGAFTNSWVSFGDPWPPFGYYQAADGKVHLCGAVKSGSSASAAIATIPASLRPAKDRVFTGLSSTGAVQVWQLVASTGVISIISGGDTTRSHLPEASWMPAA